MACVLKPCPTTEADYQAKTGSSFEVTIESSSGEAVLVYARYNGATLTAEPWTFDVTEGVKVLTLIVESPTAGDRIDVLEVCTSDASSTRSLASFYYSPKNSPEGLEVKGL